ncbi:MAG: SRPBCC family protein [Hyphomicrobium sp.]
MLSTILFVALLVLLALVAFASTRPDTFEVRRSLVIGAPRETIFPLIDDLRAFNTWNPFVKPDPQIRLSYSGPPSGKGAAHDWTGNRNVGEGRVEITDSQPPSRITMLLHMKKPMQALNVVDFTLEPAGSATRVTWAMKGTSTLAGKLMGLVFNMDRMVGGQFEKGLADLKTTAERSSA